MIHEELVRAFSAVPKPTSVEGDPRWIDASTDDIERLIDSDPDQLTADDFSGYVGLCFGTTGGPDDFRFLLPTMLRIWEEDLYSAEGWFTEYFHGDLARGDLIEQHLEPELRTAVLGFMRRALAARIGTERSLRVVGMSDTYEWFVQFASYGVFASDIPNLWEEVWSVCEPGHACAALQYSSCLIFDEDDNPIFAPYSRGVASGPPCLWESDMLAPEGRWKEPNTEFLGQTLSFEYLIDRMRAVATSHLDSQMAPVAKAFEQRMLDDPNRIAGRCQALVKALSEHGSVFRTWESLGAA